MSAIAYPPSLARWFRTSRCAQTVDTANLQSRASVRALFQQSAPDHHRLDFAGAFEDVEDARIGQNPADWVFDGKTVAAVDLQGVVGSGPGDARGQQFGHAGFEIAAFAAVLAAGGEIGELPDRHEFGGDHDELVGDAREIEDFLAELPALDGVFETEFE